MNFKNRPVVLCILDGWGYSENQEGNAIDLANLPVWTHLWNNHPHTLLDASGSAVGLPEGQMGNSEVGHMTIGAGRVMLQDLPRINKAIQDHALDSNPALMQFIKSLQDSKGICHLMGLLSPGGVHSHQEHLIALIKILDHHRIPINVHVWLDGRDTAPRSALGYMANFLEATKLYTYAKLVTLAGRYWAMDRDNRWDRVEQTYKAMALGVGDQFQDPLIAIQRAYTHGVTDEFIPPMALEGYQGMTAQDGLLIANFRSDRVRQIASVFVDPNFKHFDTHKIKVSKVLGMTQYSDSLAEHMETIFPPTQIINTLGEVVSKNGGHQLRLAETEKYAHVTFFLNGGQETLFPGEDRILVPSPKVKTYDLHPEMSAVEITNKLIHALLSNTYDLIVVNYANADMVGHTGDLTATIKAVKIIDDCLGRITDVLQKTEGILLITADHGNAEAMVDSKTHSPQTAHTCNPVPFLMVGCSSTLKSHGGLKDVAPTVLDLMGIPLSKEMEGQTLIEKS